MATKKTKLKTIDSPVYSYFSALYMSFYSNRLYVDVGKRWRGFGVFYFLLVIAIVCIPYSLKMSYDFNQLYNEQIIQPILRLPPVMMQNGKVNFNQPMPYLIKNDKDRVVSIIDTTGKITEFNKDYPYLTILINSNAVYFKIPVPQMTGITETIDVKGTTLAQPFAQGVSFVIDGQKIVDNSTLNGFKFVSQLMIYPLIVATLFSILVTILLVFAFLGQVFASVFFNFKVSFKESCRLLLVASTPMVLLLMLFLTPNLLFPGFGFILFSLLIAYFSFAIYSLRAESRTMVMQ